MLMDLILINLNDFAKLLRYTLFHGGLSVSGSVILDLSSISLNHIYQFEATVHLNVRTKGYKALSDAIESKEGRIVLSQLAPRVFGQRIEKVR